MECNVINKRIFVQGVATLGFMLGFLSVVGLVAWGFGSMKKARYMQSARTFAIVCFACATLVFMSGGFLANWYRSHCLPREFSVKSKSG